LTKFGVSVIPDTVTQHPNVQGGTPMAMPARQRDSWTREEYLAREETADYKSEYYDGDIVVMAGGTYNHSTICFNVIGDIRQAIRQKNCVGFDSNMKLDIRAYNLFVYPDIMVVCGDVAFSKGRQDAITNPLLIIEVLSDSTEMTDRIKKFAYYQSLPSVREYVLIAQKEPKVEAYVKQQEKSWLYTVARGLDDTIVLRSIAHEFALRDMYHKVEWSQAEHAKNPIDNDRE
jgi:Uma2 family endonuclease